MRDLARAWDLLRDGMPVHELGLRLAAMAIMMLILWAGACVFMLMEPLP